MLFSGLSMQDIQATYVILFSRPQHLQIGLTDDLLNLLFEVCSIYVPVIILHFVIPILTSLLSPGKTTVHTK